MAYMQLQEINDAFEGNIKLLNETTKTNYFLSSNIKFNKNILNVFKYIESKKNKTTTFRYISNIQVNDNQENITSLCNITPTWGELIKKTFNNFINCISKLFSTNKQEVTNINKDK